ncbi:DNA polymerase III subunit chi [Neptunomonas sp.]|uniref:DNA polymerase III subunit chi n=1 Tax=Neptunomonas sp. TaxID=1971898 RepID=UPI0025F4C45E|nr:DNA polymerase III subunit chi [Neptunomonas sp.]
MSQADFYILPSADEDSRYQFLGKLATRAISAGHWLYIHTDSEHMAERISERLWQSSPESFLANSLPTEELHAPILIGWQLEHIPKTPDMLVNLSAIFPTQTAQFSRVAEIVIQSDEILGLTRARFKDYQTAGIQPRMHDMRKRSS